MNYFSKRTITQGLTGMIVCILTMSFNMATAQQINFSGTWRLNDDKTDYGQLSLNSAPLQVKVSQSKQDISIERLSKNETGETHTYVEKLSFDGKPVESTIGGTHKSAVISWSADQQVLTETGNYAYKDKSGKAITYKGTQVWTLSADGKTLTLTNMDEGDDGKFNTVYVYDKQ